MNLAENSNDSIIEGRQEIIRDRNLMIDCIFIRLVEISVKSNDT